MSNEYIIVLTRTRHKDLLLRAHGRNLPRDTAKALLEVLRWRYGSGHIDLVYRFGAAGLCEVLGRRRFRITLGRKPTVGTLLHEFAHCIDRCKHLHGDRGFVDILDMLLVQTQAMWDR